VSDRTPPPDLADHLGERVADWYAETTLLRAQSVTPLDDRAWVALTPRWPDSFATNCVVVRRDPGGERLAAWADERLGGAGLSHRYVSAYCELTALVEMALPLPALVAPCAASAELVDLDVTGRLHRVLWTDEWMPGIAESEVAQLVDRRLDDSAGETLSWAVRDPAASHPVSGDLVACTDLCLRGWTGEIDAVATLKAFRARGYAAAVMASAIAAATERGCSHVVLSALADDWPRAWYSRLGFVEVGVAWEALRRDDGITFASFREAQA
jgi:GNAT superfamily N-acetyltransferase